jgi:dienelactone hydrolase
VVDHREVRVHFTCEDAVLAGTLYLPPAKGRHPAVVWVHGSGDQPRLPYGADIVAPLVQQGVAVFSYDKRGVGESAGDCCTSPGHYNLVAADADGALLAVRSHPAIDPRRVGFYGASEAGWVVPLANARLREPVAFTALVDGPAVTTGEEEVWSEAAGEEEEGPLTAEKKAEATLRLQEAGPSGFDPAPYIERMSSPGLWLYGGADKSIPTDRSAAILRRLNQAGKVFTVIVFPGAGHGLVDTVPTAPDAPATLVRWIEKTVKER